MTAQRVDRAEWARALGAFLEHDLPVLRRCPICGESTNRFYGEGSCSKGHAWRIRGVNE